MIYSIAANMILVCALIAGFFYHEYDIEKIQKNQASALQEQAQTDVQQCAKTEQPATIGDNDEVTTLTANLNACFAKLRDTAPAKCVPVYIHTRSSKTASCAASGLTSTAIVAQNLFCDQQVDSLNSAKLGMQACVKSGLCK